MHEHSLRLLEFDRVAAAVASHARCPQARSLLSAWRPLPDAARREAACADLAEALRRHAEPGPWCDAGEDELSELLDAEVTLFVPEQLLVMAAWLQAAHATREAWAADEHRERYPRLAAMVSAIADLTPLRERLERSIEPDGRISDRASTTLRRARNELVEGERRIQDRLERWARGVHEDSHVTRRGDRFVAMVPAAGFSRSRGIVHDVSGSGQSLYVEPIEFCEANNRVAALHGRVAEEERRVLLELTREVRDAEEAIRGLERALVELDTLRARAGWALEHEAVALTPAGTRVRLKSARHPLLAMGARRSELVPLDLELEDDRRLLLVSGPNMGGKTVLLKTVGLAVVMAHAAFPVLAAEGSAVPVIDDIRVDMGDEQSVDEGLSTFAGHAVALASMAGRAGPDLLVLADELGSGTDPEEGAALGQALVELFAERRAWGVVTTHLGQLKRVAAETPGILNGSLEYDTEAMKPLYRFLSGVPGSSHGLEVAGRMGVPEPVLERARGLTPESSRNVERLIEQLQRVSRGAEEERLALAEARRAAAAAEEEHRDATESAKQALAQTRRQLTRESEAVLAQVRELWQSLRREARKAEKSRTRAEELKAEIESAETKVDQLHRKAAAAAGTSHGRDPLPREAVTVGLRVRVADLGGVVAEVASEPDPDGRVALKRGSWSIQGQVGRLFPVEENGAASEAGKRRASVTWEAPGDELPLEVDLRGMDVDEAIRSLDSALDRAILAGLRELRIIHGLGKGVLKSAVATHLRGHPQVAGQRMGELHEGGRGVTVATLQ